MFKDLMGTGIVNNHNNENNDNDKNNIKDKNENKMIIIRIRSVSTRNLTSTSKPSDRTHRSGWLIHKLWTGKLMVPMGIPEQRGSSSSCTANSKFFSYFLKKSFQVDIQYIFFPITNPFQLIVNDPLQQ